MILKVIGNRRITKLYFEEEIDGLVWTEKELADLVMHLDKEFHSVWYTNKCTL